MGRLYNITRDLLSGLFMNSYILGGRREEISDEIFMTAGTIDRRDFSCRHRVTWTIDHTIDFIAVKFRCAKQSTIKQEG